MAKKRDRRVASASNNRRSDGRRRQASEQVEEVDGTSPDRKPIIIFLFFVIVVPLVSFLVYRMKFTAPDMDSIVSSSESHNRLVKTDITYQEILSENSKVSENASHRNFVNPVLVYVTPWNSRGYELAKKFSSKFTHISPVWYDLKSEDGILILDGRHNVDKSWISELRASGGAQLLPRVLVEAAPYDFLRKKKQRAKAIKLIVAECKEMGYDGIVLESWSRWMAYGILNEPNMRNLALHFLQELGEALHSVTSSKKSGEQQKLELVYVIGPPRSEKLETHDFGPEDLQSLSNAVDGFSLMTYDFSNPRSPGPNAPLNWIRFVLKQLLVGGKDSSSARKIFLGINFYGNDFILSRGGVLGGGGGGGGGAILGGEYLSLLDKYKPSLQWEKNSNEHFFLYTTTDNDDNQQGTSSSSHAVFYPSLMSIFARLQEARSWGCGISIWEIGQGLDYFFDLL